MIKLGYYKLELMCFTIQGRLACVYKSKRYPNPSFFTYQSNESHGRVGRSNPIESNHQWNPRSLLYARPVYSLVWARVSRAQAKTVRIRSVCCHLSWHCCWPLSFELVQPTRKIWKLPICCGHGSQSNHHCDSVYGDRNFNSWKLYIY